MVLASSTLHGVVLSDVRASLHFYHWQREGELSLLNSFCSPHSCDLFLPVCRF